MVARTRRRIVKLPDEPQMDGWRKDNAVPEAIRPPVPHVHVKDYKGGPVCPKCFAPRKMNDVHTSSTQRAQTFNGWLVTAIAVVAGVIGALFGSLIHHP
jgi:hypothetical protein